MVHVKVLILAIPIPMARSITHRALGQDSHDHRQSWTNQLISQKMKTKGRDAKSQSHSPSTGGMLTLVYAKAETGCTKIIQDSASGSITLMNDLQADLTATEPESNICEPLSLALVARF